jgi:hypothetical protein
LAYWKTNPQLNIELFFCRADNHIYDMIRSFIHEIIYPLIASQHHHEDYFSLFSDQYIKNTGLIKSFLLSDRHERQYHDVSVKTTWEPVFHEAEFKCENGLSVVPLLSSEELTREGKNLSHCVATYSAGCAKYQSHIYSVRQDDKSISTFEFTLKKVVPIEVSIIQHRGHRNSQPSKEAMVAVQAWKESLKNATVNKEVLKKRIRHTGASEEQSIEDYLDIYFTPIWRNQDWQEERWQVWRRVFDTSAKTPQQWISRQSAEFQNFLKTSEPLPCK